jgi:two-component system chemotaxis response regulator CheB
MIRVLIVEDSPTASSLLRRWLDEEPTIQVIGQASDGQQAVKMAARLKPDPITMDVVMPDMDGLEATQQIMAHRPTPILILTAHADSPETALAFDALKAGAVDLVAKPVDGPGADGIWRDELLARIHALGGAQPRPVAPAGAMEPSQTRADTTQMPNEPNKTV